MAGAAGTPPTTAALKAGGQVAAAGTKAAFGGGTDQTIVATAAAVTFASVAGDRIAHGEFPSGRLFAATCLAFAGLGLVAMASPDIGKGLAIAVAGTAFVTVGLPVILKYFPDTGLPLVGHNKLHSLNNPIADALNASAQKGE
jgi:hypothetical protein